jgi:hypothetical protein
MLRSEPYVPAARPVLAGGEEARLVLVAYGWPPGDAQAEATAFSRDGKPAGRGELRLEREAGTGGAARWVGRLKPPRLPPGEYVLEIKLSGPGVARTRSTPFVVSR